MIVQIESKSIVSHRFTAARAKVTILMHESLSPKTGRTHKPKVSPYHTDLQTKVSI